MAACGIQGLAGVLFGVCRSAGEIGVSTQLEGGGDLLLLVPGEASGIASLAEKCRGGIQLSSVVSRNSLL